MMGLLIVFISSLIIYISGLSIALYFQLSPTYSYITGSIAIVIITELREVLK